MAMNLARRDILGDTMNKLQLFFVAVSLNAYAVFRVSKQAVLLYFSAAVVVDSCLLLLLLLWWWSAVFSLLFRGYFLWRNGVGVEEGGHNS